MGFAASEHPFDVPLVTAAVLGVTAATGLWWLYFDMATLMVKRRLEQPRGEG